MILPPLVPYYPNNLFMKCLFPLGNHYRSQFVLWGNLKPCYRVCSWPGKTEEMLFPRWRISSCPLCPIPTCSTVTRRDGDLQQQGEKLHFLGGKLQKVELTNAWAQFTAMGVLIGTARPPSGGTSEQPDLELITSPRLK